MNNIQPAVERTLANHPKLSGGDLIEAGIEENVWQSIEDLFSGSPATRQLVKDGHVKVVGAIYDVGTGRVEWLPESRIENALAKTDTGIYPTSNTNTTQAHHGGQADQHAPAGHTPAESDHGAAASGRSIDEWVTKIGVKSSFETPVLKMAQRPSFGAHAGHADELVAEEIHHMSFVAVYVFAVATIAALAIALLIANLLSHTQTSNGHSQRQFTLGAKLVCAFGVMAFMILLVSTVAQYSLYTTTENEAQFSEVVQDAALIESIQRDVLKIELSAVHFLQTFSNEDLEHYTEYAGGANSKVKKALEDITDPQEQSRLKEMESDLKSYEKWFEKAVSSADHRNGVVESQLVPTGDHATLLLEAII